MTYRVPVYVGGPDVVVFVCPVSCRRWADQKKKCEEGPVKDPYQDKCWFEKDGGVCRKNEMEHEGA